jgi:hypothetical protein
MVERFQGIQWKTEKIAEWMLKMVLTINIHRKNMLKVEIYACILILLQIQDDVLNSNVEPA